MSTFKFRLQNVIDVRTRQEQYTKREIARIASTRSREEAKLAQLQRKREVHRNEAGKKQRVSAAEMQTDWTYLSHLTKEIEHQGKKISIILDQENLKREELLKTNQSKQMLETLKEKKYEEYKKDVEKKDQTVMDNIAQRLGSGH